jgi:hypothetical protein
MVFGAHPVKILFDERTQVYRDGTRIPLHDLRPEEHASVQTVLDGTNVFALSIHILSQTPQGECQGKVMSFNAGTGELSVASALSPQPIHLFVPAGVPIIRVGQSTFTAVSSGLSDLTPGALVSVDFAPGKRGLAIASRIEILAIPGSEFILDGTISYLDLKSGLLVLADSRNDSRYQVYFDLQRIPAGRNFHVGDHVTVDAEYQTARYIARGITVY